MTNGQKDQELKVDGPPNETLFWTAPLAVVHPKLPALHAYLDEMWVHYRPISDGPAGGPYRRDGDREFIGPAAAINRARIQSFRFHVCSENQDR